MRNFVLLFLLLNILAFAYQRWIIEPDNPVDALFIDQQVPGLVLAEIPKAPPVEEVPDAPVDSKPAEPAYRCLRIGPFAQETDAVKVRLNLQRREATVRQTAEPGRVWVGHWVQIVDSGDRQKAEVARDALIASGIRDAYIVSGTDDNRISLGVYSQRASADQTVRKARKLGYATRVDDRYQPGTNFWLRVQLPGNRNLQPGEFKSDTGQILRTESIPCAEAST